MLTRIHFVVTFVSYMLIVLATICMIADDTAYLCVCVCVCARVCVCVRSHNNGEYTFTKIFVLVKGMKECNIFFFSKASVSSNLTS